MRDDKSAKRRKRPLHKKDKVAKYKKRKTERAQDDFSEEKFKLFLRDKETTLTGFQKFLEHFTTDHEDKAPKISNSEGLALLKSYLLSSSQCTEVLDVLSRPQKSSQEVHAVFQWLRIALKNCKEVVVSFSEVRQHIVNTLFTNHTSMILNSLRQGNRPAHLKTTLLLLADIVELGYKYARLILIQFDFNHHNLPHLLLQRDRKDPCDVRSSMMIFLMRLLLIEDLEITKTLVDQKVLLQETLKGLAYDRSEYVKFVLITIHDTIVTNEAIGKTAKVHLFSTPVLREVLALYQLPGPMHWKSQPSELEKRKYTSEQMEVADVLHAMLIDLCATHKPGICFNDKTLGATENKNPAMTKLLETLLTSYTTPKSHELALAILKACPDQVNTFLKQLHPHLVPRSVDTWITCVQFFKQIIQNHAWPSTLTDPGEGSDRISQLVHFLFPPENIINTLKDGLNHSCPTVQHQCLQALLVIMRKGQHFHDISSQKFGDNAPLTQAIHGFILKVIPTHQVLLHVLHQIAVTEKFSIPITRDLYKDTEMPLPLVTRFEHLVTILKTFCEAPHLLNSGPSEMVPRLVSLLTEVTSSSLEIDMPPTGMSSTLPALCLLQAFSACDVRKLSLFGEPGNKGEKKVGLLQQLIGLTQSDDAVYGEAAQRMIVKILLSTGLFEGHEGELHIWLRHLECSDDASSLLEVVTFLVDILRQYIVNPYPANDQLVEMMDEEDHLCMDKTALSHHFSPLSMLALKSSVHSSENVKGYICRVLVDILHSLHDSRAFIKVVHALSQQLDLHVIGYVALHVSEEPFTWSSVEQSFNSKSYLRKESKAIHPGLLVMKRIMKESEKVVPERAAEVVAEVSTCYCLPLLQQSLCYIHKIVCLSSKSMDVSNNRKLTQVCIEIIKAVLHRMSASSKATNSSEAAKGSCNILEEKKYADNDEAEEDENDIGDSEGEDSKPDAENKAGNSVCEREMLSLMNNKYCVSLQKDISAYGDLSQPGQVPDSFTESLRCLLQHPLSRWVFSQGFKQYDTDFGWLVSHYCSILLEVLDPRNAVPKDDLTAIAEGCRQQMWLALKDYDEIPDGHLPLLGKCVEVLFSASGYAQSVSALFRLLRLPQKCFLVQTAMRLKVTDLCKTLIRIAENVNSQPELMSNVLEGEEFSVEAVEQLFDLVSILKDTQLELLALNCLKMSPALAIACTDQTWQRMLNDFVEMNAIQRELFEKFMTFSPMCRILCSKWIQENHTMLGEKDACLPMVVFYLQLTSRMREDAADDPTVQVIADFFRPCLNEELLPLGGMALQIISILISCGVYDLQAMHKAKEKVVRLATSSAQLLAGHFHILAAVLRQEAVSSGNSKNEEEMNNGQEQSAGSSDDVLVACLRYLTTEPMTSSNGWQGSKESMQCLVELLSALLSRPIRSAKRGTLMGFLPVLVKSCLKYHYKDPKILVLLRKLVIALFAKGKTGEHVEKQVDVRFEEDGTCASFDSEREETSEDVLSTVGVYSEGTGASTKPSAELEAFSEEHSSLILDFFNMCVGHSEFLMVMKGRELQAVKDELVWLLVTLQQLEKKCCSVLSYNILMAAYGASLSLTDQRILFLVAACEKHGGSKRKFRPVLWGDAAVSYFEVQQHIGPSLIGTLQLKQVMDHIDPSIMDASVRHFPLLRTADGKQTESAEKLMSQASCYDPCFFLPLFCHFLGPEHVVEIRPFINNNSLGLVLAALSSHEAGMRKLAFLALANFYAHIEGAHRLPEKSFLLAFLELLRNSLTKENQKLSCTISLFLARAVKIISDPGHNMYCAIQSFLLLKPALDVSSIPEFYKFFNSAIPLERDWLLQLLQDGLRETSDHRVFERRYFFKLVTSHISSSLGDVKTVRGALRVLIKGCSIATVAKDWVVEHGLLPWLTSFIRDCLQNTAEDCQLISQVLHQLWFTTGFSSSRVWWLSLPGLARNMLKSSILACVHLVLSKSSTLNKQSLEWLLRILHNPEQPNLSAVTQPMPSLVALAMWHLGHLDQSQEAAFAMEVARQLSFCGGFHLPSLAHASAARRTGKREPEKLDAMTHTTEKNDLAYVHSLTLSLLLECDLACYSGNSGMIFSPSKAAMVEAAWTAAKWVLSESHRVESGSKLVTLVMWVDKVLTYIVQCGEGDGEHKLKLIDRLPSFLTNLLSSYAAMAETLKPGLPSDIAPTSRHSLYEVVAQLHKLVNANIYTAILEQLVSYWCFRCSRDKQEQTAGHASCGKQTQWQGCSPYAAFVACLNNTVVHVLDVMHQSTENDKLQTSPHWQAAAPFWDVIHWCQSSNTKLHQEVLLAALLEACLKRTAPASALIMMKIITSGDKKPKGDKREDSAKTPKLRKEKRKSLNRQNE